MTALASDRLSTHWYAGPPDCRYPSTGTQAAETLIYLGAVCMHVNGVARPVLSGSSLAAVCTLFDGSGANDGLYVRARTQGVTLALTDPSGNSQAIAVSITFGTTTAIVVSLATDGGGAITSTPNTIAAAIRAHAAANKILAVDVKGTGADAVAAVAATAVAHVGILGASPRRLDNSTVGGSALTLGPSYGFEVGGGGFAMLAASGVVPTLNDSWVSIVDDQTVSKSSDGLDFMAPLVRIEGTARYYVDLSEAK